MSVPVFVYHQPIPGCSEPALAELSKASWEKHGFHVVVLNEDNARTHPRYHDLKNHEALFKGVASNMRPWYWCNWVRWLALAEAGGGGFFIEWDIINYGFTPDNLISIVNMLGASHPINLSTTGFPFDKAGVIRPPVPSMWNSSSLRHAIELMCTMRETKLPNPIANKQMDDQLFFSVVHTEIFDVHEVCWLYSHPGWESAKLVHYANYLVDGRLNTNRAAFINAKRAP